MAVSNLKMTHYILCNCRCFTVTVIIFIILGISRLQILSYQKVNFFMSEKASNNSEESAMAGNDGAIKIERAENFTTYPQIRQRRLAANTEEILRQYLIDNHGVDMNTVLRLLANNSATANKTCIEYPTEENDESELLKGTENENSTEQILSILAEGEKLVNLGSNEDIILVLGNTGSGKSTITNLLAGNTSQIYSVKSPEGNFIIIDGNNKIGRRTTVSKTLYPDLLVEPITNSEFYDCPGFSDTRSIDYDIAANYFIKKVVDSGKRVKILLLVIHPSVRRGYERHDFMKMLKHITSFVKNFEIFKHGLALVVTKVSNYNDAGFLMTDNDIISGIVDFLNEVKQINKKEIKKPGISNATKKFLGISLKFLDILLEQKENKYPKISFSRSPNECGTFNEIKFVMDTKARLEKLYQEQIEYVTKSKNDFGYSLSESSINIIHPLIENINYKIANLTKELAEEMKSKFIDTIYKGDILRVSEVIGRRSDSMFKAAENMAEEKDPETFIKSVYSTFRDRATANATLKQEFINHGEYLNFFEEITGGSITRNGLLWKSPLSSYLTVVREEKIWFESLGKLYEKLITPEVQNSPQERGNAKAMLRNLEGKTFKMVNYTLLKRVDKMDKAMENILVDSKKFNQIRSIFNYTLLTRNKYNCNTDDNELQIEGNFIKLSEYKNNSCLHAKKIVIFALDTVFINTDIHEVGKEMHFLIFAPNWNILGPRDFKLQGITGSAYESAGQDCTQDGNGEPGKPGSPGGNGGSLIGLGKKFKGGHITINVSGGNGGPGQNGGNGCNGKDGRDYTVDRLPSAWRTVNNSHIVEDSKVNLLGYIRHIEMFEGDPGEEGGRGGSGGKGGHGGINGYVKIFDIASKKLNISNVMKEKGRKGHGGKGGKGGAGGKIGNALSAEKKFIPPAFWWSETKVVENDTRALDGSDGEENVNTKNQMQPKKIWPIEVWETIVRFRHFLLLKLDHCLSKKTSREFFDELSTNQQVTDYINEAVAFGEELLQLEKDYYSMKDNEFYIIQYHSLLERIEDHLKRSKGHQLLPEYKKALSIIYTATYSKICTFKQGYDQRLITDIYGYFEIVSDNIRKFKEIQKTDVINTFRSNYKSEVESQLEEALKLIDSSLLPELEEINSQISLQIYSLLNETIENEKNIVTNSEILKRNQRDMNNAMLSRFIFGTLKTVGQAISFLGPQGAAVGMAIGTGSFILEPLLLNAEPEDGLIPTFNPVVTKLVSNVDEELKISKEGSIKMMNEQIEDLKKVVTPEDVNTKMEIKKCEQILSSAMKSQNKNDPELQRQLLEIPKSIQEAAAKDIEVMKKTNVDEKAQKSIKRLHRASNALRTAEVAYDVYKNVKHDKHKLDIIGKKIREADIRLKEMGTYKNLIRYNFGPLISNMLSNIAENFKSLEQSSATALVGSQWKVQNLIRKLKLEVKKFTDGFESQKLFIHYIENLEEAMNKLISVYDKLQNYREKQKLADYIANVNSASSAQIHITNPKLDSTINKLNLVTESNIFLVEYDKAINAIKQRTFPFASLYSEKLKISPKLFYTGSEDTNSIIENYIQNLDKIKRELQVHKTGIIKAHDDNVHKSWFRSDSTSSKPFFVWKNNEWNTVIRNLLSGNAVKMKADIRKSFSTNDAIKFNVAELNFNVKNQTLQKEINKKLRNFKVNMNHTGNSYFRFQSQYYVLFSEEQQIEYSFERRRSMPTDYNLVYEKLKNGDFVLSPYTLWDIQLHGLSPESDFEELLMFTDLVDLELVGFGSYVDSTKDLSHLNLHVEQYYQADHTLFSL